MREEKQILELAKGVVCCSSCGKIYIGQVCPACGMSNGKCEDVPIFYRWSTEESEKLAVDYLTFKNRVALFPDDAHSRNRLIELLYDRSYRKTYTELGRSWQGTHTYDDERKSKINSLRLIRELLSYYTFRQFGTNTQKDKMELWALLLEAEVALVLGDIVGSLQVYEKILSLPVVRNSVYEMKKEMLSTNNFSYDDAENILRVVHNISVIFRVTGFFRKAKMIYSKYNTLVKIYYNAQSSIAEKLPQQAETIMHETEIICGFKESNIIYVLGEMHYFPDMKTSLIDVIMEHPEEKLSGLDDKIYWEYDGFGHAFYDTEPETILEVGFADFDDYQIDIEKQKKMIEVLLG